MKDAKLNPMTFKQQMAADLQLANPALNNAEIGEQIGLSESQVTKVFNQPQVKVYMASFLDKAGATLDISAKAIAEAHGAKDTKFFSFEGEVTDEREVVDHQTRLKAAEMNLKIRGEWKEGGAIQLNQFLELSDAALAAIAAGKARPQDFNPKSAQDG